MLQPHSRSHPDDPKPMLTWLFKKSPAPAASAAQAAPATSKVPVPSPTPAVDWAAQLAAAQGDDPALLRLAQSAAPLATKLSAVQALVGEEALRQAEREFRSHDRKVHRVAKQRLEAAVLQRETRAQATVLLAQAKNLADDPQIPANRVADLDREWAGLAGALLEPTQRESFEALRHRVAAALREQADTLQALQRWSSEARLCLQQCATGLPAAAAEGSSADVAALSQRLNLLRESRPEAPATARLDEEIVPVLQAAAWLHERLSWLEAPTDDIPAESPPAAADPAVLLAWRQRLADLQRAREPALEPRPQPRVNKARPEPATPEQVQQAQSLLQQAETALAEGQLAAAQKHLQALQPLLAAKHTVWPDALLARQQAVWAEQARLKDWQQWGGERARDDLVAEAQALARQVQPPAEEAVTADVTADVTEAAESAPAPIPPRTPKKPNLKALGDSIQALRQRWKSVDRQGVAASAEQWQAFDAALQVAHGPLAAQHAAVQLARQQNLAAREALLAALEALPLPGDAEGGGASGWRELQRQLFDFQGNWRKLGPIEHTAPAASRSGLEQRLQQAAARLEAPLRAQQDVAVAERERLIVRAQACLPAEGQPPHPDAARQVRELQADWQVQARGLPLPRGIENALWARFKAATDAVFSQREAALGARDAERAANLAAAEQLVQRLESAGTDLPLAQIEATLAEVDRAWRQGGELPRGAVDSLEARYRSAHAAAVTRQREGQRQQWQLQCEALAARLRQFEAHEDAADGAPATGSPEAAEPAAALPALPKPWEQALTQRLARPPGARTVRLPAGEVDDGLLRLEMHLQLPAAPEWQAARQQLKLRALKAAMEGRKPTAPAQPAQDFCALLQQPGLNPAQRSRLQALVAALRDTMPRDFP